MTPLAYSVSKAGRCSWTVRRFKEGAATIRVDLHEEGVEICNTRDSWFHLLRYVAFAHNSFACPGEGARTAREMLADRQLSTVKFCNVQFCRPC